MEHLKQAGYLWIPASSRREFIYRTISVDRLLEMFARRQNVLVVPSKWEDPFENFILNWYGNQGGKSTARPIVYGQCWTREHASDAMWRIYSPGLQSVRIRSRVCSIAESLVRSVDASEHVFVGRVKYFREDPLVNFANATLQSLRTRRPPPKAFAETLLAKRVPFAHEQEVRLLLFPNSPSVGDVTLRAYDIDPHSLFDQIMLDLDSQSQTPKRFVAGFRRRPHFRGDIKQSMLHAPPSRRLAQNGNSIHWKAIGARRALRRA